MRLLRSCYRTIVRSWVFRWLNQVVDPIGAVKGLIGYPRYFRQWWHYARMPAAESIRLKDTYPCPRDRIGTAPFDSHYFHVNGWAARRILARYAAYHVDVGSQVIFANMLGAMIPVVFVDYRPLKAKLSGLHCVGGDLLSLSFAGSSVTSLSCLHVIEHIGLGRYGDPLNPHGTRKAARELTRVLAPGGDLWVGLPVGQPRVCFNAHRIHPPQAVRDMFAHLRLIELSGVHDDGRFVEAVDLSEFEASEYACGFFWFRRE